MPNLLDNIIISSLLLFNVSPVQQKAFEKPTIDPPQTIEYQQPVVTKSSFVKKRKIEEKKIERKTIYQDNPEIELGEEVTTEEGADGKKTLTYDILYHQNEEFERELIEEKTTPAKDKIVHKGTKIVWKTLDTPDGPIQYYRKMRVYATHYDSHCPGCDDWTAIGMRAGKGVIAVDPSVIKLRSKVYIPGYGQAVAGDTGGAIKGNIIDLGFEDAKTAGWSARYVDIYLL